MSSSSEEEKEETKEMSEVSESDQDDDMAPVVAGVPTKWGANFDHCIVKSLAVVQTCYDGDRKGVSVVQVHMFDPFF